MARILIIDDEEPVRLYLRSILEREGYKVIEACDGKSGLQLYRQDPADLIITDIFMPEKEGLGTIRELKRDYPGVKIIAISGGGKTSNLDFLPMAKKLGALRALNKPFTKQEILDTVKELLDL